MFDIISSAFAQEVQTAAAPVAGTITESGNVLWRFAPFFLILVAFYVLLIRPQQKQEAQHEEIIKKLKKGDKVITRAGIVGVITKVEGEHYVLVEIARGVEVKVVRATITGLVDERHPANENKDKPKKIEQGKD
ncbi:MAG: preprotein translocase subunit YajC [Alphaproteobacteria bacterium]|nr:preprotein translocase subunit YajC [Alphaproteobacteria bacterium]